VPEAPTALECAGAQVSWGEVMEHSGVVYRQPRERRERWAKLWRLWRQLDDRLQEALLRIAENWANG
jgi:hypothetical protein